MNNSELIDTLIKRYLKYHKIDAYSVLKALESLQNQINKLKK